MEIMLNGLCPLFCGKKTISPSLPQQTNGVTSDQSTMILLLPWDAWMHGHYYYYKSILLLLLASR
jgi:hypothetical protein